MVNRKRHISSLLTRSGVHRSRYHLLLAALCLVWLGACSFNFVYRQLDWLVPWQLSDYVSIDEAQRSELEQRLIENIEWHCSTQLSAYADWFREMQRAPQPFTRAELERHYWRSVEFWQLLMEQLSPDITALLLTASDGQVRELMTNLERRNRELEKRYVSAGWKKVRQRRIARMEEILRRWIGPLTEAQQQILARWADDLGQSGEAWIENRRRWQRALGEAFALRTDPKRFGERIRILFVEPRQLWPEGYRQEYARLRARTLDMLAEISASGTDEQQRYFNNQLLSWAEDFERLTCTPPGKSNGHDAQDSSSRMAR